MPSPARARVHRPGRRGLRHLRPPHRNEPSQPPSSIPESRRHRRLPRIVRSLAGDSHRRGHLPGSPACPPSRLLLAPTEPPNQPLATLTPVSRRPRPDLRWPSPEFPAGPPPAAPRGYIANAEIFPGPSLQKVNSNS
jgi:hypothetical protein